MLSQANHLHPVNRHHLSQPRLRVPRRLTHRPGRQLLRLAFNPPPQLPIHPSEHLIRPPPNRLLRRTQMPGHVPHEVIPLSLLPPQNLPQLGRLHEILIRNGQLLRHCRASPFLVFLRRFDGFVA